MVLSYTTRKRRPNDLPGEYKYIEMPEYEGMCKNDLFLWTAIHGSTHYGTTADAIKEAFKPSVSLGIMILVPEVVLKLISFLRQLGVSSFYAPIFVVPPERPVLEKRLRERGDSEAEIQKRLDEAESWVRDARASEIPYAHVSNDSDIAEATKELLLLLKPN